MKIEINIERSQSISDAIFDALTHFLCENLDFHGELHTYGAGAWVYQTANQIMSEELRLDGQSLDDLQEELDEISEEIPCETKKTVKFPSDWNLQKFVSEKMSVKLDILKHWNLQKSVFKKMSVKYAVLASKLAETRNWRRQDNSIFFEVGADIDLAFFVKHHEETQLALSECFGVEVDFFVTLKKEGEQSNIENPEIPKNLASLMNPTTWQRGAKNERENPAAQTITPKKPLPVLDALKNLPEYKNSRPISENFSEKN